MQQIEDVFCVREAPHSRHRDSPKPTLLDRLGLALRSRQEVDRHSFATHLIQANYGIRTVQELMGHENVRTTMISTHVLNKGGHGGRSPFDKL